MTQQNQFSLGKIIKIAAIITGALALIEVIIIVFITPSNHAEARHTQKNVVKPKQEAAQVQKPADTPKAAAAPVAKRVVEFIAPTPTVKPTPTEKLTAKKVDSTPLKHPIKSTKTDTTPKAPPVKTDKTPERLLSQQSMVQLLNNIKLEKTKANNSSNCVQIRKTSSSNVSNAFEVADFLKKHGYIISGRMTTGSTQKGIAINAVGSCLTVTIGSM